MAPCHAQILMDQVVRHWLVTEPSHSPRPTSQHHMKQCGPALSVSWWHNIGILLTHVTKTEGVTLFAVIEHSDFKARTLCDAALKQQSAQVNVPATLA